MGTLQVTRCAFILLSILIKQEMPMLFGGLLNKIVFDTICSISTVVYIPTLLIPKDFSLFYHVGEGNSN